MTVTIVTFWLRTALGGTMPFFPRQPYDEIQMSDAFVIGRIEAVSPFGGLSIWRIHVEKVVKGHSELEFVYVVALPNQEEPFGPGRGLGDRAFLGLEATRLRIPADARPADVDAVPGSADAEVDEAATYCFKVDSSFRESLSRPDSYFQELLSRHERWSRGPDGIVAAMWKENRRNQARADGVQSQIEKGGNTNGGVEHQVRPPDLETTDRLAVRARRQSGPGETGSQGMSLAWFLAGGLLVVAALASFVLGIRLVRRGRIGSK